MDDLEAARRELDRIAAICVDRALYIHRKLGPGLLESAYMAILLFELRKAGLKAVAEVPVSVIWEGVDMGTAYRADIVVEGKLITEVKATNEHSDVFARQLHTYLKLLDSRLGLVVNFGRKLLKDGIERVANNF